MSINTKRFKAGKTWTQVSTGNVTLTACVLAASYHIYAGTDTPADDTDFVTLSGMVLQHIEFNHAAPVWIKINVTNSLNEAEVIAIGELAAAADSNGTTDTTPNPVTPPVTTTTPNPVVTAFSTLKNCNYDGKTLTYNGGTESLDVGQYEAIADPAIPIQFIVGSNYTLWVSKQKDDTRINVRGENGLAIISGKSVQLNGDGYSFATPPNDGDIMTLTIEDGIATIKNISNGQVLVLPYADNLVRPIFMGLVSRDTSPTTITTI